MNALRLIQNLPALLFRRGRKFDRETEFLGYEAFPPAKGTAAAAPEPGKQPAALPGRKAA